MKSESQETLDAGVTEIQLEGSKGMWEAAGDEGIVNCHHCFVP